MREWETFLVPWLLKEVAPKASGGWWPTHCWQISRQPGGAHPELTNHPV